MASIILFYIIVGNFLLIEVAEPAKFNRMVNPALNVTPYKNLNTFIQGLYIILAWPVHIRKLYSQQ